MTIHWALGAIALNHDGTRLLAAIKFNKYLFYLYISDDCYTNVGCDWRESSVSEQLPLFNGNTPYWSACTHSTTADVDYM